MMETLQMFPSGLKLLALIICDTRMLWPTFTSCLEQAWGLKYKIGSSFCC